MSKVTLFDEMEEVSDSLTGPAGTEEIKEKDKFTYVCTHYWFGYLAKHISRPPNSLY